MSLGAKLFSFEIVIAQRAQIKIGGQLKSNLTVVTLFLILQLLSYTVPSLLIVCSWAIQSDIWPRKVSMGCWCAEDKTITIILFWGSSPSDWSWGKTTVWEKRIFVWEKRTKLGPNQLPVEVEQSKRTRCMLYCCIRELCTARLNKCITNGDGQKIPETIIEGDKLFKIKRWLWFPFYSAML